MLPKSKGPRRLVSSDLLGSFLFHLQTTVRTLWIPWLLVSWCSLSASLAFTVGRDCLSHATLLLVESSCRKNLLSLTSNHVLRCLLCNSSPPSNKHLSALSSAYVHSHIFWAVFCFIVKIAKDTVIFFYSVGKINY